MPRRSNAFQQLVHTLYAQLSEGATVTESSLLDARDGTRREVDILIEYRVADVPMRIAVECRDRGRASDVEWIDALVGKYRDLPVDRVIAVSRKGFSKNARRKASGNRIELRTLRSALAADWPQLLASLRPVSVFRSLELLAVVPRCTPPLTEQIDPSCKALADGEPTTVDALIQDFVGLIRNIVREQIYEYGSVDKVPKVIENTYEFVPIDVILYPSDASAHRVDAFEISVRTHLRLELVEPTQQLMFGEVGVMVASHYVPELNEQATVTLTQTPGEPFVRMSEVSKKGRQP